MSAQRGNQMTAFGLNFLFALSNVANDAFRFIAPDSQLLSSTPTNQEFTGQLATGAALVGTVLIGPGGEAGKAINITKAGLAHALERHAVGVAKTVGKSLFHAGEDIQGLIKAAESVAPYHKLVEIWNALLMQGEPSVRTGQPVMRHRRIPSLTRPNGDLVTAFPGRP